jgi:Uncharacterized protein conserved in bacteria
MLRRIVFGLGLVSATVLSHPASAEAQRTLQIVISKATQSMKIYDGETVVATSRVSTGKSGHTTPSGIFSILEKRKYHESNIYSNAPMPFMQRLTWSGIALHEGHVPDYPASHGCVRLPRGFAKALFGMTEPGLHVVISDEPVEPVRIEHVNLFAPLKPLPSEPLLSDIDLRPTVKRKTPEPYEVAMNSAETAPDMTVTASISPVERAPLKILVHRRGERETVQDVQVLLNYLGFDAGSPDGLAGSKTRDAIAGFKRWKGLPADGARVSGAFLEALYRTTGKELPPAGQLLVRRNFRPLFEAPVGIREPEKPLGTHFLTATGVDPMQEKAVWHGMTLSNVLSSAELGRLGIAPEASASSASEALGRLDIPADVRERIATLMSDGTSLTITDQGLGPETGKGTDFVTLTRSRPQVATAQAASDKPSKPRRPSLRSYRNGVGLY